MNCWQQNVSPERAEPFPVKVLAEDTRDAGDSGRSYGSVSTGATEMSVSDETNETSAKGLIITKFGDCRKENDVGRSPSGYPPQALFSPSRDGSLISYSKRVESVESLMADSISNVAYETDDTEEVDFSVSINEEPSNSDGESNDLIHTSIIRPSNGKLFKQKRLDRSLVLEFNELQSDDNESEHEAQKLVQARRSLRRRLSVMKKEARRYEEEIKKLTSEDLAIQEMIHRSLIRKVVTNDVLQRQESNTDELQSKHAFQVHQLETKLKEAKLETERARGQVHMLRKIASINHDHRDLAQRNISPWMIGHSSAGPFQTKFSMKRRLAILLLFISLTATSLFLMAEYCPLKMNVFDIPPGHDNFLQPLLLAPALRGVVGMFKEVVSRYVIPEIQGMRERAKLNDKHRRTQSSELKDSSDLKDIISSTCTLWDEADQLSQWQTAVESFDAVATYEKNYVNVSLDDRQPVVPASSSRCFRRWEKIKQKQNSRTKCVDCCSLVLSPGFEQIRLAEASVAMKSTDKVTACNTNETAASLNEGYGAGLALTSKCFLHWEIIINQTSHSKCVNCCPLVPSHGFGGDGLFVASVALEGESDETLSASASQERLVLGDSKTYGDVTNALEEITSSEMDTYWGSLEKAFAAILKYNRFVYM